jgi:hypothetical protein
VTDAAAVRLALRALATRDPLAEATLAAGDVREAAAFVDAGGLDRLRRARERAERRGEAGRADRCGAALTRYRRLRAAARGESAAADDGDADSTDDGGGDRATADRFRSARGTVFSASRQRGDR